MEDYQHVFKEINCDPSSFVFTNSIAQDSSPELNEVRGQIMEIIMREVKPLLTFLQLKVLYLHLEGCSQSEIGNILVCRQSTVNFHLYGRKKPSGEYWGGILNKMKEVAYKSQEVKELLFEIARLQDDGASI